jgi:hypothetical protein
MILQNFDVKVIDSLEIITQDYQISKIKSFTV